MGGHSSQGCSFPEKLPPKNMDWNDVVALGTYSVVEDEFEFSLDFPQQMNTLILPEYVQFKLLVNGVESGPLVEIWWTIGIRIRGTFITVEQPVGDVFIVFVAGSCPIQTLENYCYMSTTKKVSWS